MKKKSFFSNKKHIVIISVILSSVLVVTLGIYTFAKLIGMGFGKGVIYSTEQHFTSNILRASTSKVNAVKTNVRCEGNVQSILIMNYDLSNFAADEFDIKYELYCYVTDVNVEDQYKYYIQTPTVRKNISDYTESSPYVYEGYLPGGNRSVDNFDVLFVPIDDSVDEDVNPKASVCVIAVPVMPDFMSSTILGATITRTSESFAVNGAFVDTDKDPEDLIAFKYMINAFGVVSESEHVFLKWDPEMFELDKTSKMYRYLRVDDDGWQYIDYSPKNEGESITVTFYRTDNWGSGYMVDDEGVIITDSNGDPVPYKYNSSTGWSEMNDHIDISLSIAP